MRMKEGGKEEVKDDESPDEMLSGDMLVVRRSREKRKRGGKS